MLRPLVGTWFQVLFHSPKRGTFHLSLTVLVRYRSPRVLSLGPWSGQIHTGFHVPGATWEFARRVHAFGLRAYHPLREAFPNHSAKRNLCNSFARPYPGRQIPRPRRRKTYGLDTPSVWAYPSSLAATTGVDSSLSFPGGTKMFQFPPFPSSPYVFR